ncbi:sel1 repeat family protein [Actinomadura rayongensis]|uniref:Sel1 repeat family protein n=1 Tax=Actinomadura rayongensis TaxID=1429076 RepID=A0A6I4W9D6_9ACTN|nr:sel1 repeat family protein [Actinomadura rayongensis]MXQ66787.1 hypothetical protein [Actinomadura rayongensis]
MAEHPKALDDFVAELNALYILAGCTLPYLRRHSQDVLIESTTSEILAGHRARVPKLPWVAAFVTACRAAVGEAGLDPDDLGMGTVQDWAVRRAEAERACGEVTPPRRTPTGMYTADPKTSAEGAPKFLRRYGTTGLRLFHAAASGAAVGEAAYQLAALLLCYGRDTEGNAYLRRAGEAGHRDAVDLCSHLAGSRAVRGVAHRIARAYQEDGDLDAALVFFEAAASRGGNAEACFRIGLIHAERGAAREAVTWFRRAARLGHGEAFRRYAAFAGKASATMCAARVSRA